MPANDRGGRGATKTARRPAAPRRATASSRPRGNNPFRRARLLHDQVRRAWDRPLTAYYLIVGAGLLILVLGLVMVYSASMIKALELSLPGSYFFRKQLLAAVIG
ncbi:cell division protein FtsW, partial [Streptomyces beijiangensis]|nr:cell division protein FtsW [Streptomyces beijiangensis]